ncbi:MAG: hypothetical protein AAGN35_21535 [Bacteroidota bacterium]
MKTIQFELTLQEANTILAALGQLPYARVHGLIRSIHEQAATQLNGEESLVAETEAAPEKELVTA